MTDGEPDETRAFWNRVADDWRIQVAEDGDDNRLLNSDPVLWRFAGDVDGLKVLDAGCGTGYLSRKLADRGARVTAVDFSQNMIGIAKERHPDLDFRLDSCAGLETLDDQEFDLLVSNYVLMDVPDLDGTLAAFHRVLKPGGAAVLVFSHPCFPQGGATASRDGGDLVYRWQFPYFERKKCVDPPWGHFDSEFIWFHRPLSDYWKAFRTAGFTVEDFEEPRIDRDRRHLARSEEVLMDSLSRPYSVVFRLERPA